MLKIIKSIFNLFKDIQSQCTGAQILSIIGMTKQIHENMQRQRVCFNKCPLPSIFMVLNTYETLVLRTLLYKPYMFMFDFPF